MALNQMAEARLAERLSKKPSCKVCRFVEAGHETDETIRRWVAILSSAEVSAMLQEEYGDIAPADTTLRRHIRSCAA